MPQKTALKISKKSKILEGLNKEQEEAVKHREGPVLIVAGAGTGKTTVITRRIAYLIENGVKPEEIIALAFAEKAAAEMEERVDQLLPYGYYNLQISTFHSFCEKILKEHGLEIGLPDFKVLDVVGQWLLVRNNLEKFDLDYYRPLGNPTRFIKALIQHFSKAKDELISPKEYLEYAEKLRLNNDRESHNLPSPLSPPTDGEGKGGGRREGEEELSEAKRIEEVANAYHVYQKLLLDNTALDFGDLINYSLELFKKRPKVLDKYRARFKHILIDEFQDTNYAQYQLIKLLAANPPAGGNITVVGDDDQSIFKFRGASISNILHFQKDYPKAKFISLTTNYRTRQKILDEAYEFIKQNNPDRLEVKLKIPKKLRAENSDPGFIENHILETYLDEADFAAGKILELLSEDASLTLNDFAVLARSHEALGPVITKLEERNISHIYFANRGLYDKPIILDLISYFKLLDNYHESDSLYRVLKFSVFNISHTAIIELGHFAKKKSLSLYEALKNAASIGSIEAVALTGIKKVLSFLDKHTELARKKSVNEVYVQVFNDLGWAEALVDDYQSQRYIASFNKKIQNFLAESPVEAGRPDKSLRSFLNELNFELEAGDTGELEFDPGAGPEAVKLMTVHGAKGLEFTYVFVIGLVDKRFPSTDRREQIEIPKELIKDILPEGDIHLEEERRLFYVAMTRAKRGLYLTRARDYGGKLTKKPSRFLIEMGLASTETSKPTGRTALVPERSRRTSLRQAQAASVLPIPQSFSFSQISLFRSCSLGYKAKYILGIPEKGTASLSFGQTIHKTFEKFLRNWKQSKNSQDLFGPQAGSGSATQIPPFKLLEKFYQDSWIDDWYDSRSQLEDYRELGKKILRIFYDEFVKTKPKTKFLEEWFKLRLSNGTLRGKIDRADESSQGLVIIDYKTGKDRPIEKVDREQLLIYQWAAQDYFKEKVQTLEYWFLGDGFSKKSFLGKDEDIEKLKENYEKTIEQIIECTKTDNFYNLDVRESHDCQYRYLET